MTLFTTFLFGVESGASSLVDRFMGLFLEEGAKTTLAGPDIFILIGYFLLMMVIGIFFYRQMKAVKDYFSGGNSIPWWLSGASFYMSSFSVFAFVGYSALAFKYGFVGVTLLWVAAPATLFSTLFFAKRWRRARIDSPVEYLETRYSPGFRQLLAWQGIPVKIIDDALKLIATGLFLAGSLGVNSKTSMIASGLIILAYTFMGGLWAVAVTDFIQFVVMAVAVLILLPLSIKAAMDQMGGAESFFGSFRAGSDAWPEGFFSLTTDSFNWVFITLTVAMYCVYWSSANWPLIQRYYCVKDEKEAVKVGWFVTFLNVIGPPLMFFPAMLAIQFIGVPGGLVESYNPDAPGALNIYPLLCRELLPVGMLGLVIAAMFAATMSMLSSDYNVCAGVITNDMYKRLLRPNASQKELVLVGRLATLAIGVFALAFACSMAGTGGEGLFRKMLSLFGVISAPIGFPMVFGLLTKRITTPGAFAGWFFGLVAGVIAYFSCPPSMLVEYSWPIAFSFRLDHEMAVFAIASVWTVGAMWIVSLLTGLRISIAEQKDGRIEMKQRVIGLFGVPSQKKEKEVDEFFSRLEVPIGRMEGDNASVQAFSPFVIVGISMVFIGLMMLGVLPWVGDTLSVVLDAGFGIGLIIVGLLTTCQHYLFPANSASVEASPVEPEPVCGCPGIAMPRSAAPVSAVPRATEADVIHSKPALLGGRPVRVSPFPHWPIFDHSDEERLLRSFRSGKWGKTAGTEVAEFERRFAEFQQAKHAIGVINGTVALRIGLMAAGVKAGDEVIVPPFTFIATASSVLECGAVPVFADLELNTFNICPKSIEACITERTKAIIVVHLGGLPCHMDAIMEIAKRHHLIVIEDSAHAHGAEYKGRRVGAIGHLGTFSFQSSKNICCGEGGIIVTNDDELAATMWSIHNCGRRPGRAWYEHFILGGNFRLPEFQGAVLNTQLDKYPFQLQVREENAKYLANRLLRIPGIYPQARTAECTLHGNHLFPFRVVESEYGLSRERFIEALTAEGVPAAAAYPVPLYKQPVFENLEFGPYSGMKEMRPDLDYRQVRCPNCETISLEQGVWFEHRLLLGTREDMDDIVRAIRKTYENRAALAD